MGPVGWALVVVFLIGLALGAYALMAPRRRAEVRKGERPAQNLSVDTVWPESAGTEFASLSESARCDMVFAVATLDGERAQRLLEHALNDPSEAVALAAAHALAMRGRTDVVDGYLASHPGGRADRMAHTLALLAPEP